MDYTSPVTKLRKLRHEHIAQLSADTGIPQATLIKIRYGTTTNPRMETLVRLAKYFDKQKAAA